MILDFGLAGDDDGDFTTLTGTGESLGTPAYMSPEQLMARRIRVDRRTDVYSLGVTLFECLTLERPFRAARATPSTRPSSTTIRATSASSTPACPRTSRSWWRRRSRRTATAATRPPRRSPTTSRGCAAVNRSRRATSRRWSAHGAGRSGGPCEPRSSPPSPSASPSSRPSSPTSSAVGPRSSRRERQALRDRIDGHLEAGFDALDHADPKAASRPSTRP